MQVIKDTRAIPKQARMLTQRWQVCTSLRHAARTLHQDGVNCQIHRHSIICLHVLDCCSSTQVPEYPSASHGQQPEAYQQHYGVPQYPGPPPQYSQRGSSGGLPTVVWVIVGAVIATIVSKIAGVVRSPGGVQGWVSAQQLLLHQLPCLTATAAFTANTCICAASHKVPAYPSYRQQSALPSAALSCVC